MFEGRLPLLLQWEVHETNENAHHLTIGGRSCLTVLVM